MRWEATERTAIVWRLYRCFLSIRGLLRIGEFVGENAFDISINVVSVERAVVLFSKQGCSVAKNLNTIVRINKSLSVILYSLKLLTI